MTNLETGEIVDIILTNTPVVASTLVSFNSSDYAAYSGIMVSEYRDLRIIGVWDKADVDAYLATLN